MYFNHLSIAPLIIKLSLFASLMIVSSKTLAQQSPDVSNIEISPTKCVAMRQDQTCYISAQIIWQLPQSGEYCLYSDQQVKPLKCWLSDYQGDWIQDFVVEQDITFTLKTNNSEAPILSAVLHLAWVHKKEKISHSSWRVF
jgi:hypothetical protein